MNTLPNESTCPRCGKPVALNAFEGLCPECLMRAGFGTITGQHEGEKSGSFVPPTPEEVAKHFPQLEIIEMLGRGGMGAVYKARQTHLDRIVALKILPPSVSRAPAFAERFVREAKALAKLQHPNIVTLYESGQADDLFYFLMEYVDGVNLRQLLSSGNISAKDALAIVPQICDALQFAHDRGIVHRDIKPENILLNKAGQVKIADFGVAKLVTGATSDELVAENTPAGGQTEIGKVIGTPQYMAPEQISHPLDVDNRADIYALGVVFYQMLTGELPAGKFEPPSRKVQVDVRLDEIVLRALEKQPELRYQQASVLKTQVETIAMNPVPPIPVPPIPVVPRPGNAPSPSIPPGPDAAQVFLAIFRWFAIVFVILILALVGGGILTNSLPKVFIATAQIQVMPKEMHGANGTNPNSDQGLLLAEFPVMQSPDLLLPIIKDLNLQKIWARRVFKSKVDVLPQQDALSYMGRILHLDLRRGTNIIDISASSEVPLEAADIANAVADRYKASRDALAGQISDRGEAALSDQIARQKSAVATAMIAVDKARQDLSQQGIQLPASRTGQLDTDLAQRKRDLLAAQEDYDARKVLNERVNKLPDDPFLSTLAGLGREQPDLTALRTEISKTEVDITGLLKEGFTEGQPQIVSARAGLKARQDQLAEKIAGLRRAMNVDVDMAKSRVALLQQDVIDLTAEATNPDPRMQPFHDAMGQLEKEQTLLDALKVHLQQDIADARLQQSPVRIISRAEPPEYPSKPNERLCYAISAALGLLLGIVVATIVQLVFPLSSAARNKNTAR